MTSFIKIYEQAIITIDDPILMNSYKESKILFCKKMFGFLTRAIPLFHTPSFIYDRLLSKNEEPSEDERMFVGDGIKKEFQLLYENSEDFYIQEAFVNGVRAKDCLFSEDDNLITFKTAPSPGSKIKIIRYRPGYFKDELDAPVISILSMLLISLWAEKEQNFLLDIRRNLNTTDFKLTSSASSLDSKVNWHYTMLEKAEKHMSKYAYKQMFQGRK